MVKQKLEHKKSLFSIVMSLLVYLAAGLTFLTIMAIVGYILVKGIPYITPSLFAWTYTSENVSLLPAFINTLFIVIVTLIVALPMGIGGAIYLVEYAKQNNRFIWLIRLTAETLTGIPSIVYGLFGAIFFVKFCHLGLSLLSGSLTLAIMVLPIILRTTEEALVMVPNSYREGSYGLGAGKLRTIMQVVLPAAMPGILSGVILSIGRIVGESAALIFTAGTVAKVAMATSDSARSLAVHMYVISGEGLFLHQTYATAVVLLFIVIGLNLLAEAAVKFLNREH